MTLRPSDLIQFDSIPKGEKVVRTRKDGSYWWYQYNGYWYPHRKPNLKELIEDKFANQFDKVEHAQ